MDRFIDGQDLILTIKYVHLKSNMDRFIAGECHNTHRHDRFKIQYG